MDDFKITFQREKSGGIVSISGYFSAEHVKDLYDKTMPFLHELTVLILDLEGLEYIDSSGIAAIIGLSRRISDKSDGHISLCSVQDGLLGIFRIMKLDRLFPFHKDKKSALQAEGLLDKETA